MFSVNGIKNGKRADNYKYIVQSMPERLSFEHVDFIRQELDVHDRDPNIIIGLLLQVYEEEVKLNLNLHLNLYYLVLLDLQKMDSWKDVAALIQHTLKKLSQKELIFIRMKLQKNKTDPNDLFDIFVTGGKKQNH